MQLIPRRSKRIKSYINLNLKFPDFPSIFTAFHVPKYTHLRIYISLPYAHTVILLVTVTPERPNDNDEVPDVSKTKQ